MADFLANLWESVFTAGPTPTLLVATNVTFGALQILLAGLLIATYSIHFAILSILSGGLWWSINWFATELQQAQAKEAEAERLRRRQKQDEADDEGEDTEVEDAGRMKESFTFEPTKGDEKIRKDILDAMGAAPATGSQLVAGGVQTRQRKKEDGNLSASEMSTDSEWEKVDEGRLINAVMGLSITDRSSHRSPSGVEQTSVLHRFPPELRNNIFGDVLQHTEPIGIHISTKGRSRTSWPPETVNPLALAQTCKQFHAEATPRFYAINTFRIESPCNSFALLNARIFLEAIGPANSKVFKGLVLVWSPATTDKYSGVNKVLDEIRAIIRACRKLEDSVILALTSSVHIEMRYSLCVCWQVTSRIYTMRLDCANILRSLRSELEDLEQMKAAWAQSAKTPDEDMHARYLLGHLCKRLREILDHEDRHLEDRETADRFSLLFESED